MPPPVTLYCFRDEADRSKEHLARNSFAWLATNHPRDYIVREFNANTNPSECAPGSVLHVRMSGDRIDRTLSVLAHRGVRAWLGAGVPVVFDDSAEVGFVGGKWSALRSQLDRADLPQGHFIFLQQHEHGPDECTHAFSGEARHQAIAVVFHFWLHRTRFEIGDVPTRPDASRRELRFLNLNLKMRSHRLAVVGWLLREGLFERGLVSHFAATMKKSAPELSLVDAVAKARLAFPSFDAEISMSLSLPTQGRRLGDGNWPASSIPWDLHARTGFSLVNETEMRGRETLRFTEKTLKALAAWHPVVVAGNVGTLKLLRTYGFRTFAPWIDESYDEIENPEERLRALLAEAKRLITLPEDAFDQLLCDLEPALHHNAHHFMNGLPAIMDSQHQAFRQAVADMCAPSRSRASNSPS